MEGFERYLKHEKRYSANTIKAYLEDVYEWLLFTKNPQGSIEDARAYIAFNIERGYSTGTVRRKIASIGRLYKFLKRAEGAVNPFEHLPLPKLSEKLPEVIDEQIFHEIMDNEDQDFWELRDKAIIITLYGTGLRCSELINLTHSDISGDGILVRGGKGNRDRMQPIGRALSDLLGEYMEEKTAIFGGGATDPVFINTTGKIMTRKRVYDVCLKHTGGSPHAIRHSYATHMLVGGAHISSIKELMGHRSIASTQRYIHLDVDKLKTQHKKLFA